jgi:fimbrial isopeptide formation D2 family protein/LPXTG-motif cell wall-anchored protein
MKKMKKIFALVIAMIMVLGMSTTAFAANNSHTITITNNDQYVSHSYEAYQVFAGDLNEGETILSNVQWGSGVNGEALLTALKASTDPDLLGDNPATTDVTETNWNLFTNCSTAADVAKVVGTFASTNTTATTIASAADAFAEVVGANLSSTKYTFTESSAGKTYTATVPSDGYYFIKDTTTTLNQTNTDGSVQSDSVSKYILEVVKDVTVVAKDTGIKVDKSITGEGDVTLKEGSSAIGDVLTFKVEADLPNTSKFDEYSFTMKDKLDAGLTFFGIDSVKIGNTTVNAGTTDNDYTLTVKTGDEAFTVPADVATAVTTTGGQLITIDFNKIKTYGDVAANQGQKVVITYKAVLNEKATKGKTPNKNEVYFEYSRDPQNPQTKGETPKINTKTYVTELIVKKVDGSNAALEGAVFKLEGSTMNFVVVNGEKFEKEGYVAKTGETIGTENYYKLSGGSFTTTPPTEDTKQKYDNEGKDIYHKVTMVNVVESTTGGTVGIQVVSDSSGNMSFTGLKPGTYTLTEIAAPDGFNLITTPVTIKIDWNAEEGFKKAADDTSAVTYNANNDVFEITIVNESGAVLPSTGGIGTTIFYIVGAILVIGAGVVLVTRRRMNAQ